MNLELPVNLSHLPRCIALVSMLAGCSSTTVFDTAPAPAACNGSIGAEPVVLAELPSAGVALADLGDALLLTTATAVALVDPCTGAMTTLAEEEAIVASAIVNDDVYYVTTDIMGVFGWLHRAPLHGGEAQELGDLGTTRIAGGDEGLFALVHDDGVYRIVEATEGLGDARIELAGSSSYRHYGLVGATPEGIYLRDSYDAGSPLPLRRWSYEGEVESVVGTEGAILADVSPAGIAMYREAYEGALVWLDADGEEKILAEGEAVWGLEPRALEADGQVVCYRGSASGPRCRHLDEAAFRPLDASDATTRPMLLRVALYWVREVPGGFELVAAMP